MAAAMSAAVSCTREAQLEPEGPATGYELLLRTEIEGMATKATVDDVPALQEDVVKTLDVYIYGTFKGDASASVKGFHLNANDHYDTSTGKWTVTPDWRTEHLVAGNSYILYVAANSSKVKTSDDSATANATQTLEAMAITSLEDLGNAIEFDYDPSTNNGVGGNHPYWGANNDDGVNPAWLALHKKYTTTTDITSVSDKADRYFTNKKTFLMNGTSASFTPQSTSGDITVTPTVTLSRAASKINVNVSIDAGFLSKLASEKQMSLAKGEPHWRFYDFAFNTPIFSDLGQSATYTPESSRFTSAADMIGYAGIDGNDLYYASDNSFSFSTYCYPLTWTAATAGKEAPAILLSVGFRDDSDTSIPVANRRVEYHSYKIPVVNPELGIYSLDRNKIYTINAHISSEGSTLVTDAYAINAAYSIMDWSSDAQSAAISERDNSYIDVIPDAIVESTDVTDVIIRGNGEQTYRLHVLKPDTKSFSIAYYGISGATHNDPFGQTGTPTDYALTGNYTDENGKQYSGCAATGAQVPYYINLNGDIRNTIDSGNIQNCFVKDGDDLLIISTALPNKGVKYMKIRVFLDGHKTDAGKYMDVNIRHYPTDAIIAIEGRWSSRQSACLVAPAAYQITSGEVIHGPEDYTLTESVASRSDYESHTGYKRWEWVECDKATYDAKSADERSVETGLISQDTFKAHTSTGTVSGTPETGYEKHVSTYDHYFRVWDRSSGSAPYSVNYSSTVAQHDNTAQSATDEAHAFLSNKTDEQGSFIYYWGEGTVTAGTAYQQRSMSDIPLTTGCSHITDNYDYVVRTFETGAIIFGGDLYTFTPYSYEHRYRVYYTGYIYKCKKYYITTSALKASTPRWINWDNDLDASTSSGSEYYQGARYWNTSTAKRFYAKIISDGAGYVTYTRPSSGTSGTRVVNNTTNVAGEWCVYAGYGSGGTAPSTLYPSHDNGGNKNRYMYVLQQSETSSDYTIGKPVLDPDTMMSSDNVVSPAFMTASQLAYEHTGFGAPSPLYAALHCASYLEVATDGTYYTGWRLPTRQEIATMIRYQGNEAGQATLVPGHPVENDDRVMDAVLTATYYCALDGIWVNSSYRTSGTTTYSLRCVRDLSPEEVEALNY